MSIVNFFFLHFAVLHTYRLGSWCYVWNCYRLHTVRVIKIRFVWFVLCCFKLFHHQFFNVVGTCLISNEYNIYYQLTSRLIFVCVIRFMNRFIYILSKRNKIQGGRSLPSLPSNTPLLRRTTGYKSSTHHLRRLI